MLLQNARPDTERAGAEDGYLLLTVLVMIFLVLLALSVAAPRVAKDIQRDKEREAVQRGLQYRRAIQLYYKKFGAYPTDIKQLEKTNEIRFLRKRYKDPITGKDDWRLIHMGEAKVPPLGFFGQPLQAGLSSVSTGPGMAGGSIYAPTNTNTDGSGGTNGTSNGTSSGSSSTTGSDSSSSFGFSNSGSNSGSSSGGFGSSGSSFGSSSSGSGFGSPSSGGVGTTPTGTNGPGASSNGSSTFGSAGPIVGIGIPVKKDSILTYHKQKKYSDWEFVYDPQTDLAMAGGATGGDVNGVGTNGNAAGIGSSGANGTSSGGSGTSSGFGFSNGSSSGSSGSGFGSSGSGFGSSGSGFGSSGSGFGSSGSGSAPGSNAPSSPQQ
jgi:type II secretory pathway pseudopilin PulG